MIRTPSFGVTPERFLLPEDCPVVPVGIVGAELHFSTARGESVAVAADALDAQAVRALFMGRMAWLYWAWPVTSRGGVVTGWDAERAIEALMEACAAAEAEPAP